MKKVLSLLIFIPTYLCSSEIALYQMSNQADVFRIAFQNPENLIGAFNLLSADMKQSRLKEAVREVQGYLHTPEIKKFVIIDEAKKVVGFIVFKLCKDMSLETLQKQFVSAGKPEGFNADFIKQKFPAVKALEAECKVFLKIMLVGISSEARRKGHGKKLLNHTLECVKAKCPLLSHAVLIVNVDNTAARGLYESVGFALQKIDNDTQIAEYQKNF